MSLKNIFTIVIVLAVIGAGAYFILGSLGDGGAPAAAIGKGGKILPLGSKFDTDLVKKFNPDSKLFNYPKVGPGEVGPVLGDIARAPQ